MKNQTTPNKIGFHYYQDTAHYTHKDLTRWLPELKRLSAGWIVLRAEPTRAIPEHFLSGLIEAGITPLVHMTIPLPNSPSAADLKAILEAYARWGVRQVILFDKPNSEESWSPSSWSQQDLVERFIDRFLPLAMAVLQAGMTPVFPALEPGGNYWDLSFLKQSIESIQRRGYENLIRRMGLAAYAYTFEHDLDWGAGGPSSWPGVKPYQESKLGQNQCGFNNFEWMQSIVHTCTHMTLPVFLLGAGVIDSEFGYQPEDHAGVIQSILERLNGALGAKVLPDYIQSCHFYTLCADESDDKFEFAWIKNSGEVLPIVDLLTSQRKPAAGQQHGRIGVKSVRVPADYHPAKFIHPLDHYLLLSDAPAESLDLQMELAAPFIAKKRPTIGFSPDDAMLARKVTIISLDQEIAGELVTKLEKNGCVVEQISGDGTTIATQLAER